MQRHILCSYHVYPPIFIFHPFPYLFPSLFVSFGEFVFPTTYLVLHPRGTHVYTTHYISTNYVYTETDGAYRRLCSPPPRAFRRRPVLRVYEGTGWSPRSWSDAYGRGGRGGGGGKRGSGRGVGGGEGGRWGQGS